MLVHKLTEQIDIENNRLNKYGDILTTLLKHEKDLDFFELDNVSIACFKFSELTDSLNNLYVAILNCKDNKELLKECIPFVNELSFLIASFAMGIMKIKEEVEWKLS